MPTVKVASFNIEWMNKWFTSGLEPVAFRNSDSQEAASRAAATIREMDADILAIQEGPNRREEMELFIQEYLTDEGTPLYQFILHDKGGAQKLAILYKPDAVDSIERAPDDDIRDLADGWNVDVNGDLDPETYFFTRLPLVINAQIGGSCIQLIVLHTKSKFVNNGEELWGNTATQREYIRKALSCRRRISAEAMRARQHLDNILRADQAAKIIVMGDLNDGPGMGYFEEHFLTHNTIDALVGSAFEPELIFHHAQHDVIPSDRYTAIFDDFITQEDNKHLLLDHILLSPGLSGEEGLRRIRGSGMIHHSEYENNTVNNGKFRDNRPSDHRPVSVLLEY